MACPIWLTSSSFYGLLTAVSDSESFNPYESVDGMLVRGLMVVAEVGGEVTVASSAVD
jgi:hypothetical protein